MSWVPAGVSNVWDCVGRPVVVPMHLPSVAMSLQLGTAATMVDAELGQGDRGGERGAAVASAVAALSSDAVGLQLGAVATVVVSDTGQGDRGGVRGKTEMSTKAGAT